MKCELHLTNIPCDVKQWLKLMKAKTGKSMSQIVLEAIYETEEFEKAYIRSFLKQQKAVEGEQ